MKPVTLRLEEATSRVYCAADAGGPPEVTRDEVRVIVERYPLALVDAVTLEEYLAWDEPEAVYRVWLLKASKAAPLIDSASAGQSHQMSQVRRHCLEMAAITQPTRAA